MVVSYISIGAWQGRFDPRSSFFFIVAAGSDVASATRQCNMQLRCQQECALFMVSQERYIGLVTIFVKCLPPK